ncbi:HAD family hydrolase [Microbacterium sp. H1-D42]|uniref:HAD family hydrolase n=1 Tax=Microbacterium sp. H1-D42 TaxID=2925844 RepID=UPI001F53085F|nr:HAD family hydrolase [Microbacterium sp. H1-D42]UNK69770.1 HAD family hydrolase [Microbacterium sp. H1-D42]
MSAPGIIVFDLDGTLVDQLAAVRRWTDEFVIRYDVDPALSRWITDQLTARAPKDEAFERISERVPASGHPSKSWRDYRVRMPELVSLFPGTEDALRGLRRAGWVLGIATNGMADNQVGKIRRTGLDALVDGWVVSSEIGVRKPDPLLLTALATQLDVPLHGWMVGDGMESDIEAGRRAGLRTARVCAAGDSADADLIVPDVAAFAAAILTR